MIDVPGYLAALPADQRAVLAALRRQIRQLAPTATEKISYGIPTFNYHGHLVGFGAAKKHCSLYVMDANYLSTIPDALVGISWSASTVRFTPEKPLPPELVTRIVHDRMAANLARSAH